MPMRRPQRMLAVDCGASHVACAVFSAAKDGRLVLQRFAVETHSVEPGSDAAWLEATGQALQALAGREKLRGPCVVAMPGHLALTKRLKVASVTRTQREEVVRFEAAQALPVPLTEVIWAWEEIADDGLEFEFALAAVKRSAMTGLGEKLQQAGFTPLKVIPGAIALWLGAAAVNPTEEAGECDATLIVDVGARSTQMVFTGQGWWAGRTLALGGNVITLAMAEELKMDYTKAEALKRQIIDEREIRTVGGMEQTAYARAVQGFLQRLESELRRSLLTHAGRTGTKDPVRLVLTGRAALLPGLQERLTEKFSMEVAAYDPLVNTDVSATAKADGAMQAASHLGVLVGLACAGSQTRCHGLNLLPEQIGRENAARHRRPWLVAAAVLLGLALLPALWHFQREARVLRDEVARLQEELGRLRGWQNQNAVKLTEIAALRQQTEIMRTLVESKASWIEFLAALQECLGQVEDVWIERLQVLPDPGEYESDGNSPRQRLALSGRLLDVRNPQAKVSADAHRRVQDLLSRFKAIRFVAEVERERFDSSQPGILRFDCTLVIDPEKPL